MASTRRRPTRPSRNRRHPRSVEDAAEPTPLSLYTRLFGPGFQDPASGDWKPDPQVMLQQSVLSAVSDERKDFMKNLGAGDKARMEQYFTSVREAEMQMAAELKRPEVIAKVAIPGAPGEMAVNYALPNVRTVTPLMAKLGARKLDELIGRADLLDTRKGVEHWKAKGLDFSRVFHQPQVPAEVARRHCESQDHGLDKAHVLSWPQAIRHSTHSLNMLD